MGGLREEKEGKERGMYQDILEGGKSYRNPGSRGLLSLYDLAVNVRDFKGDTMEKWKILFVSIVFPFFYLLRFFLNLNFIKYYKITENVKIKKFFFNPKVIFFNRI